ncbi:hypothetical protein FB451DRAFT_1373823 [Mycena latifolia]|nr:hypothetical protein FB451DRAFT_1373823 [Mycena latifolia]
MLPTSWATAEQAVFLALELSVYIAAKENSKKRPLVRYWNKLEENFFERWPEAAALGAVAGGNLQVVEMYQKLNRVKIKAEAVKRGYGTMNEEAAVASQASTSQSEVAVLSGNEIEAALVAAEDVTLARVHGDRKGRMKLWRATVQDMWNAESDDVKREVQESTADVNHERAAGNEDPAEDEERTPEQYQHAIDQIGPVYGRIHEATIEEAGWMGMSIMGGPMPRRGGQISMKVICFGKTPNGNTFETSHPDFAASISAQFVKFLKRSYPHNVRDARALPEPGDVIEESVELEGLIPLEQADEETLPDLDLAIQSIKPKRIRRPKPPAVPVAPPLSTTTSSSVVHAAGPTAPTPATASGETSPPPNLDEVESFPTDNVQGLPLDFNGFDDPPSTDWGGMPPPTSPRTAGLIAQSERGGLATGMENIDPTLYGATQLSFKPPAFEFPTFEFPASSPYRPSTLFQAFRSPTRSAGTTLPSTSPPVVFGPNPASSFTLRSPTASVSPTPVGSARNTVSPATPTSLITSSSSAPSRPPVTFSNVRTTATTNPSSQHRSPTALNSTASEERPSALNAFSNVVANATAAVALSPPLIAPPAPHIPQYIQSRPLANPPKGHPLDPVTAKKAAAAAAKASRPPKPGKPRGRPPKETAPPPAVDEQESGDELPVAPRGRGRPRKTALPLVADNDSHDGDSLAPTHHPVVTTITMLTGPAAAAEDARLRREEAELDRLRAETRQRENQEKEQEKENKRLQALRHNPDGDHPLWVTSARPRRNATAKDPDGNPVTLPVKLTRAQQLANKNAPSENALLERTKRGAVAQAGPVKNGKGIAQPHTLVPSQLVPKRREDIIGEIGYKAKTGKYKGRVSDARNIQGRNRVSERWRVYRSGGSGERAQARTLRIHREEVVGRDRGDPGRAEESKSTLMYSDWPKRGRQEQQ